MSSLFSSLIGFYSNSTLGVEEEKGKVEEVELWLENTTIQTLRLAIKVKLAIDMGKVNQFDEDGEFILDRVVSASYSGTDKFLALKMLDLLTSSSSSTTGNNVSTRLSLDLLISATHQSPAFIAKIFAAGIATNTSNDTGDVRKLNLAFQNYVQRNIRAIHDANLALSKLIAQEKWKELKDGISLFCRHGCRPQLDWVVLADRVLADWQADDSNEVNHLQQVELCADVIRCILENDPIDATWEPAIVDGNDSDHLSSKECTSTLLVQDCVQRERYDLSNLLIEYGYLIGQVDQANQANQVDIKELRRNPKLAVGFSKLLERRRPYLNQLASIAPPRQSSLPLQLMSATSAESSASTSGKEGETSICLFEVPNLLSVLIDYVGFFLLPK